MGTQRNGVVALIDRQVVLDGPDVLIDEVDSCLIACTDIDAIRTAGLLTCGHVIFTGIGDVERRSLIGHVAMVAYEVAADTQLVIELVGEV